MVVIRDNLEAKRSSGVISSSIPEEHISAVARQQAFFAQANFMSDAILNPRQVQEFDGAFRDAQHQNGSTWTDRYGNLSMNPDKKSSRAAEQRSRNSGLLDTAGARKAAASSMNTAAAAVTGARPPREITRRTQKCSKQR
jgi:hypothetical protein